MKWLLGGIGFLLGLIGSRFESALTWLILGFMAGGFVDFLRSTRKPAEADAEAGAQRLVGVDARLSAIEERLGSLEAAPGHAGSSAGAERQSERQAESQAERQSEQQTERQAEAFLLTTGQLRGAMRESIAETHHIGQLNATFTFLWTEFPLVIEGHLNVFDDRQLLNQVVGLKHETNSSRANFG